MFKHSAGPGDVVLRLQHVRVPNIIRASGPELFTLAARQKAYRRRLRRFRPTAGRGNNNVFLKKKVHVPARIIVTFVTHAA